MPRASTIDCFKIYLLTKCLISLVPLFLNKLEKRLVEAQRRVPASAPTTGRQQARNGHPLPARHSVPWRVNASFHDTRQVKSPFRGTCLPSFLQCSLLCLIHAWFFHAYWGTNKPKLVTVFSWHLVALKMGPGYALGKGWWITVALAQFLDSLLIPLGALTFPFATLCEEQQKLGLCKYIIVCAHAWRGALDWG